MRKGNILLIILVVVGIVTASVGGYFWWSTAIKTSVDKQNQSLTPVVQPLSDAEKKNPPMSEINPDDWRDAQRRVALQGLRSSVESYRADNNSYPQTKGDPNNALAMLIPKYLVNMYKDPSGRKYYYEFLPGQNGYVLCASMEKNFLEVFTPTICQDRDCGGYQCNSEVKNF